MFTGIIWLVNGLMILNRYLDFIYSDKYIDFSWIMKSVYDVFFSIFISAFVAVGIIIIKKGWCE